MDDQIDLMEEHPHGLRDKIYDAIAEGKNTIRVAPTRPQSDTVTTYFVSFLMNIDNETHKTLCLVADKNERAPDRLLRRYLKSAFHECFADEEIEADIAA